MNVVLGDKLARAIPNKSRDELTLLNVFIKDGANSCKISIDAENRQLVLTKLDHTDDYAEKASPKITLSLDACDTDHPLTIRTPTGAVGQALCSDDFKVALPFAVIQSPEDASMTPGDEWLYFRTVAGYLGKTSVTGGCVVSPPTAYSLNVRDFKIDDSELWYAYVDNTGTPAIQFKKASALPAAIVGDENEWWTGDYILIATLSATVATQTVVITQYRHGNVPLAQFCVDGELDYLPV